MYVYITKKVLNKLLKTFIKVLALNYTIASILCTNDMITFNWGLVAATNTPRTKEKRSETKWYMSSPFTSDNKIIRTYTQIVHNMLDFTLNITLVSCVC